MATARAVVFGPHSDTPQSALTADVGFQVGSLGFEVVIGDGRIDDDDGDRCTAVSACMALEWRGVTVDGGF